MRGKYGLEKSSKEGYCESTFDSCASKSFSLSYTNKPRKAMRNMNAKLLQRSRIFVKRNASTILTCVGVVGVVGTAVLTAKAAPKALKAVEDAKEEKGDDLTVPEVIKAVAPAYIPVVVVGIATVTCIVGANMLNKRQQASLASAYALLDTSYKEYKKKVTDLYGEEVDNHIKAEIAKDKYELTDILPEEGNRLFYDEYSGRYFETTDAKVKKAEYMVNRHLQTKGYACVNDFYKELGMEMLYGGFDVGWAPEFLKEHAWQSWLDFNHQTTVLDDGLEVCIISFYTDPITNFLDYA